MKRVRISLSYHSWKLVRPTDTDVDVAFPFKVLDADGTILGQGAASSSQSAELELPEDTDLAYVRLTWPSGRTEIQRVDLRNMIDASVTFSDAAISRDHWSAWAVPKLNPKTPLADPTTPADRAMDEFNNVWLRLWHLKDGVWTRENLRPIEQLRSVVATQMDLDLGKAQWLLQVGGSNVTWRFVALPGGGRTRVLITPKDSTDPRADELKIVVTSFREPAETLLEFLSRDAMRSVSTLTDSVSFAKHLLSEKFEDPVSAVAGAYYLLRLNRWHLVPLSWFENLSKNFAWIPDAAIVHCARLLRSGCDSYSNQFSPDRLLQQALSTGWPVFAEGISLLQEAASLLKASTDVEASYIHQIEALGTARAWAGAATSFYGRAPDAPEALQWVGRPRAPRRRKIIRQLVKSRSFNQASLDLAETRQVTRFSTTDNLPSINPLSESNKAADKRLVKSVVKDDEEFLIGNIARSNSF